MQLTRRCSRCQEVKDESDFSGPSNRYCRPCRNEYQREYNKRRPDVMQRAKAKHRAANPLTPEQIRDAMLWSKYRIRLVDFERMFDEQGRRCALCQTDTPSGHGWHVDHDHACCHEIGKSCGSCIRAILCSECNTGLGKFRDNPALLRAAADYLERVKE